MLNTLVLMLVIASFREDKSKTFLNFLKKEESIFLAVEMFLIGLCVYAAIDFVLIRRSRK